MTPGTCPVCRARYRGAVDCSRCGADLGPVMREEATAWALRNRAREAIQGGQLDVAAQLVAAAQRRCATASGRDLALLVRAVRVAGVGP